MDGVALCARFSIATNRLQYCGPRDAEPVLYAAITENQELDRARDALRRFEALNPYLEAIGAKHGLDPFDAAVVEAYWVGNDLLEKFDREDFRQLLDALVRRGLPRSTAGRLAGLLPEHPIPHHAFHVAFVGVGEVTGHVETTIANMEACRPAWARVTRVDGTTVRLRGPTLGLREGRLTLENEVDRTLPFDPAILPGLAEGDTLAVHWSLPALSLTPAQTGSLVRYTRRSLDAANEALPRLRALA
ncbi:MAG TPA: DUF6390 family protein [Thermoplasmata archaeon]|nr:DUF6390 family protein [Thermoplasmata archaeon]